MFQEVNTIFQTFGASVVVPIIIFIIALLLRVKPKTAMMGTSACQVYSLNRKIVYAA